jgi:hypothetical protein
MEPVLMERENETFVEDCKIDILKGLLQSVDELADCFIDTSDKGNRQTPLPLVPAKRYEVLIARERIPRAVRPELI